MATQGRSPLCSNDPWVHTCAIHVYAEGRPNSGYRRYRVRGIACRLIDAGLLAASFGHEGVNWRNITRRLPTAGVVRCIINLKLHCRSSDRKREREVATMDEREQPRVYRRHGCVSDGGWSVMRSSRFQISD